MENETSSSVLIEIEKKKPGGCFEAAVKTKIRNTIVAAALAAFQGLFRGQRT